MGVIRILSDNVANKIAAGEVVERPASVVKELIENSLDAGAREVRVEVEGGGRRLIRVADDGCGMLRDDALLAFERHATSKLREVKDLLSISTLGFRGEALPSIASVSRLVLETRSAAETTGTRIEIAGGKLLACQETALGGGTSITVRDLFYNVPARRKFLRTEQTELAHIASLATHYGLANPDKTFHLSTGATELLSVTPVATSRERVYQVFGAEVLDELVELDAREKELPAPGEGGEPPAVRVFRLHGFFSRPQVQKANRNSIYIFVNGRLIRDRLLLHAISAAYHNLMPVAAYPFALLFLTCDAEEVDVNVHPSKTEVRFRHQSFVHDFVRNTLRERLMETRPAPAFAPAPRPSGEAQPAARLPYSEFSQMLEDEARSLAAPPSDMAAPPSGMAAPPGDEAALPSFVLRPAPGPAPRLDFGPPPAAAASAPRIPVPDTHGEFPPEAMGPPEVSLEGLAGLRPLGQLHDSFIIAAGRDGLWIVDQHVAHERVLFERVLRERAAGRVQVQSLLMPLIVRLTPEQQVEYARIAAELAAAGFETEPFGQRTIAVKAAPAGMGAADLEKALFEILEIAEGELRGLSVEDLRRGICASIACHAAIKINTRLDAGKMAWLLSALAATEFPMSCPHGRPIALRYGTREILKAFHRI
jgi:DNA mismatch repair protein MutL